jgi:hypothetical protein
LRIQQVKMASIRPLNETLQKIAIEELNEVPSRIPDDLTAIKEWLAKQSHLKSRTGEFYIKIQLKNNYDKNLQTISF